MTQPHLIPSFFHVITIFCYALVLAISACTRLWMTGWQSGSSTFYGVRVEPKFEDGYEASRIDNAYTVQVIWLTVAMIVLVAAVVPYASIFRVPHFVPFGGLALLFAHSLGMQALYWQARQKVLPFAAPLDTVRTVDLATFVQLSRVWKICYWTAVLLPFGFLAAAAFYLRAHFNLIPPPATLPRTFGAPMLQNLPWTRATLYGVYKPLVVAALANLVTVLVAYAFNYRSRISEWGTEVRARWTYRKLLMSRLAVLQWLTTIQNVLGALSPLAGTTAMSISRNQFVLLRAIWSLIWSVVSLALIFTLYRSRPRGAVDTASDRSWKFGQYYFNRQDPAIIVPARFAVGHTLNLGQSLAWAIQFTGVLAIIAIFAGRSYVSIPQFSVSQNQYRVRATQSARFRLGGVSVPTTDLGRLDEAVERLKQGDGTAITAIEELTQKNPNDSQILNAAAHGLALSKKELPTARIYAERAVAAKEKEIHSLELGVLSQQDISLERNMAQFWDTLGLVCHRQGDIDCAQRYLVAAWTLSPRTLFATHLAHLEEEQGNYAQAIAHFRQALGAPGSSDQKREIELRLDILDNSKKQTLRQTEQVKQEPKEHPLTHLIRRSNPFYVDLLFQNAVPDGKPVLPLFGHELDQPGPALSEREKAVIAKSMPPFPFPDTGPERVVVRARVTCLKDSRFPFSIRFFTPDEIRDFYRSAASIH